MPENRSLGIPDIKGSTLDELRLSIQFWMVQIANHVDRLVGARGTPKLLGDINANGHVITNLQDLSTLPIDNLDSLNAVPRKFAVPLTRQKDGSLAWDSRDIPMLNTAFATDPTATVSLQQIRDLINDLLSTIGVVTSTFTITGTGFAVNPTATARSVVIGNAVILFIPELTGTSNAATFTLTGLPAGIVPTQTSNHIVTITDGQGGATDAYGLLRLSAISATVTMISPVTSDGTWTTTGTKTLYATSITYARW